MSEQQEEVKPDQQQENQEQQPENQDQQQAPAEEGAQQQQQEQNENQEKSPENAEGEGEKKEEKPAEGEGEQKPAEGEGEQKPAEGGDGEQQPPAEGEQQQQQEQPAEGEGEGEQQQQQQEQGEKKEEKKDEKKDEKKKEDGKKEEEKKEGEGEGEDEEEEEKQRVIPDDFYYEEDHFEKELEDSPITSRACDFHESFGFDSNRKNNVYSLDMDHMIYAGGVNYFIVNIIDGNTQIFFSKDGGGIGAITVHPSQKYFAIAEKGSYPNIYIYEYPSLKLYRILRKGTEKSYSCCNFSQNGEILASVGSNPDYTISLWNWKQEFIILKSKAFSQEVYQVQFSQYSENILATSGLAHVKFWKVAETFTGLKLKGEIAKFGQVELSDVVATYIYPDGKVISSTEYGKLLLWEGNLIKCVINQSIDEEGKVVDCHEGDINVIFRYENDIITAGKDGYIRFWDATQIDQAEGDDFSNYYIKPTHEFKIDVDGEACNIISIDPFESYWLVSDQRGRILKVEISESKQDFDKRVIKTTNSGKILDVVLSPIQNFSITIGEDGAVRLWDYVNQREFYNRKFLGEGTCLEWLPYTKKNQARVILAGYSTGVVRWLLINSQGFHLLKSVKVHSCAIKSIQASGQNIAVLGVNGDVFVIEQNQSDLQKIEPFCFYETGLKIRDMQWDKNGEKLLFACQDGRICENVVWKKDECDTSETYLQEFKYKSWTMKMMEFQKPKAEEMDLTFLLKHKNDEKKEFEEWEPAPIMNATYYDASCSKVLITTEGKYMGWIYLVDFNQERPIEAFACPKIPTQFLRFQNYEDYLLIGFTNGQYQIRHIFDLKQYLSIATHDVNYGKVFKLAMNFDKTAVLSAGGDGFQYCYKFDAKNFVNTVKGDVIEDFEYPQLTSGLNDASFNDEIEIFEKSEDKDIVEEGGYSIQQEKLLSEKDQRKREAEKKKKIVRQEIQKLVKLFEEFKAKNNEIDEVARLSQEELTIDPEYIKMLNQRVEEDLEETRLEVQFDAEYYRLLTAKLKSYVQDELEVDTYTVKGIKANHLNVQTFKLKKLSEYLKDNLLQMHKDFEEANLKEQREREYALQEQNNPQAGGLADTQQTANKELNKEEKDEQKLEEELEEANLTGAKLERLKHKRKDAQIKRELDELEKERAAHESSEPEHIRKIDEAKRNLGDYKLKSDPDFEVQESQKKNVSKQRRLMFLMEEYIYTQKKEFNNNLKSLRDRKKNIVEKIRDYNQKITEINRQLGEPETLFQPEIDVEVEEPEQFFEISEEQIEAFQKQKEAEKNPDKKVNQKQQQNKKDKDKRRQDQKDEGIKTRKHQKVQHSELEEEMKEIQNMRLRGEKKRMQDEINEEIEQFDKDLEIQLKLKQLQESNMIISQMNLITYYQELILLVDMEEYDNYLKKNFINCKNEKEELKNESDKIVKELNELVAKDAENEKLYAEKMKEFKEHVHQDDDQKREKLFQYWYKKHKKLQAKKLKHQDNDDDDEENDDEDMDSDEDDDDDFMDDDDDDRVDMTPIEQDNGQNKAVLDKICELEDNQENYRREKAEKERAKQQIANKIQVVVKNLQTASNQLKEYQRKKLSKVNQLDVSFCLKLSQIQNLIENKSQEGNNHLLPSNLNQSILFTEEEFKRLSLRIRELQDEKITIGKQRKNLDKKKRVITKEIGLLSEKYTELNKKYEEKHFLKFGDLIDLKVLDALQPTKNVLEMREKFKQEERESIKRVEKAKLSLLEKKKLLLETRRQNTNIIRQITKLGEEQMKLNKKLDSSNKQLFKEDNEDKKNKSDLEKERQHLKSLVDFLAKEIEDLKKEIGLFKIKGGHIYTMVTSNKKNFA